MAREHIYFVYILASRARGTLYTGVTNDLIYRVSQHKLRLCSFTARYRVFQLVWFEEFTDIRDAIVAEKRIKRWRRAWKFALVEKNNPKWADLHASLCGCEAA